MIALIISSILSKMIPSATLAMMHAKHVAGLIHMIAILVKMINLKINYLLIKIQKPVPKNALIIHTMKEEFVKVIEILSKYFSLSLIM